MSGICLVAGLLIAPLGEAVTLRWTHSIQKTVWEEDYRMEGDRLRLAEARIRGTGAGMEPPADAVFSDGVWRYAPAIGPLPKVSLRHTPYAAQYEFCAGGSCRTATGLLPALPPDTILELAPCPSR